VKVEVELYGDGSAWPAYLRNAATSLKNAATIEGVVAPHSAMSALRNLADAVEAKAPEGAEGTFARGTEVQNLTRLVDRQSRTLAGLDEAIEWLEKQRATDRDVLQERMTEIRQLEDEVDELKARLENAESQSGVLSGWVKVKNEQITDMQNSSRDQVDEIRRLQAEVDRLVNERAALKNALTRFESAKREVEDVMDGLANG
jgi:chromosome segregation ATPase